MNEGIASAGDGCGIAWRLDGPPGAPVLLLANSLGTDMGLWEPQQALGAAHQLLRYDMRGHGQSAVPHGDYSMDRLGRDVVELLDALGLERVDFCGLSLGGMVGQWLAVREPRRVRRLVLANTSAFMGPPGAWQERIATVRGQGMAAIADAVIERWFTPGYRGAGAERSAPVRRMLLGTAPDGYAACCAAIRDMDLRPTAPLIAAPTLVIGGTDDPATPPEHARALAAAIPDARLKMLPAAHLSNWEVPAAFNARISEFLRPD